MNEHKDITTADDPEREELVAYLDGELEAPDRSRVERRLADDDAYRRQLQALEQAWDLLDALPRTEVGASFTQTTVEMVAVAAEEENSEAKRAAQRQRWVRGAAAAAAVVLAALLGYRMVDNLASRRNKQLARDLPV
ncbi:MAG: hypothetical protein KDA41_20970, partial [Planctomycetales bacterium]|nr:hypothetical protein [Planctomycetales bacterium]